MKVRKVMGVSLIEVLVTIAVLIMLATAAIPAYQGWRERTRLRSAAENVYSYLQYARSESIKQNCDQTNVDVVGGADWALTLSTPDASCVMPDFNLSGADYPGITLATNQNPFWFENVRGMSNGGTLTLTSTANSANVVVSLRGRVVLCGNLGGMPAC